MQVKIQVPSLPDGYEIYITGLNAILKNNQDVDVSDEAVADYEAKTEKKFSDLLLDKRFGGPGSPPTPEALEYYKDKETEPEPTIFAPPPPPLQEDVTS